MSDFERSMPISQEDRRLDALFQEYRAVCPDPEPGGNFMPGVWRKIDDGRNSFWAAFNRLGRIAAPACAAVCLLLLLLNLTSFSEPHRSWTYADALAAETTPERTYYAEAVRGGSDPSLASAPAAAAR